MEIYFIDLFPSQFESIVFLIMTERDPGIDLMSLLNLSIQGYFHADIRKGVGWGGSASH